MTDDTRFAVLVSVNSGIDWKLHRAIIATTTEQACKRVREAHYADVDALFYATQAFRPRKMVKQMVAKWEMQQVDFADAVEEPAAPANPDAEIG